MRTTRNGRAVRIVGCLVGMMVLGVGLFSAQAKSERRTYYTFEPVWPSAIRFLRVDENFEITEKDGEAGYVLFEVAEENKRFRGALELIRSKTDKGRPVIRLVLRIEDRPTYIEIAVLERLERKLRDEHGTPPPYVPKRPDDKKKKKPK